MKLKCVRHIPLNVNVSLLLSIINNRLIISLYNICNNRCEGLDDAVDDDGKRPSQYLCESSPISAFKVLKRGRIYPIGVSVFSKLLSI